MKKIFYLIIIIPIISLISIIWSYENPEKVERVKNYFKKNKKVEIKIDSDKTKNIIANSFSVVLSKEISINAKTAFMVYPENFSFFDKKKLIIYLQNGSVIKNLKQEKLNLPDNFTLQRNGGLKTVFHHNNKSYGLLTVYNNKCFYVSIFSFNDKKEYFKSKCLKGDPSFIDLNGIGSSNVHDSENIYVSIGTSEKQASENAILAQDSNFVFGKILSIDKLELENFKLNSSNSLKLKIFTKGHRNPQGLTIINNNIFSVEHGPKGGDELNKLIKDNNYGWPIVSYGTEYLVGADGKSYKTNHEYNGFVEPLFAFVPSIGISAINNCPKVLKSYYNQPCLIALSLRGNDLREGRSIVIFLLNQKMNKVISIEKIKLANLRFRHFLTNEKNELFEDNMGNIYVSADKNGLYKIKFQDFR